MYKDNRYFANQAAALHVNYYWVQIQIHRKFIRGRAANRNKTKAFTSLAVCANAARSSVRLMEVQDREGGLPVPFPGTQVRFMPARFGRRIANRRFVDGAFQRGNRVITQGLGREEPWLCSRSSQRPQ